MPGQALCPSPSVLQYQLKVGLWVAVKQFTPKSDCAHYRYTAMAECCPPGSAPYLAATYTALGHVEKLDAVELYLAPVPASVTKGLLLFPDVCKLLALRRTGSGPTGFVSLIL